MAVLLNLFVLFPILLCCVVECARILIVQSSPFNTDYIIGFQLATALLKRGHKIVMINPFPTPREINQTFSANYTALTLTMMPKLVADMQKHMWLKGDLDKEYMDWKITESLFTEKSVQKLMNSNIKFNLVILTHFSSVHIGFGQHFKAPLILLETRTPLVLNKLLFGNPLAIPHVPASLGSYIYTNPMNFWYRLLNLAEFFKTIWVHDWFVLHRQRFRFKKYFKTNLDLNDALHNNISLMLANSHFAVTGVAPLLPAIIEIGGFHIEPQPKIMISELQTFFDTAKDGVIIFSTDFRSRELLAVKPAVRVAIERALGNIQVAVLWDFNPGAEPNRPNILFFKKMSHFYREQLLAHPNVRAFISDGSLLSTLEAIHHGIPILGLPLHHEHSINIATAVADGYALSIPLEEVNELELTIALNQIVNNPKYRREAQRRSRIMRDQPLRPVEKAIFWIEHVIRHKGAAHLRTVALDYNWFQREMFDLCVPFTLFAILFAFFLYMLIDDKVRAALRNYRIRRQEKEEQARRQQAREEQARREEANRLRRMRGGRGRGARHR